MGNVTYCDTVATDCRYRLKKVQGKKKRDNEAAENKRKADLAAAETTTNEADGQAAAPPTIVDEEPGEAAGDLLNDKDADVIF